LVKGETGLGVVLDHEGIETNVLVLKEEELLPQVPEFVCICQVLASVMLHQVT
jgi:hypothetical protein